MKRTAIVALIVGVLLLAGCGLSQAEVAERTTAAYNDGYSTGYDDGEEVGHNTAYQEAEESLGMTVEEAKTNLDYLASLPKPLHDPTYDELVEFLSVDQTAEEVEYDLSHIFFTHTLLTRAGEAGIQAYPIVSVMINYRNVVLAGFNTTDKGWVYILPWGTDREIELEIGDSYSRLNGNNPFNFVYAEIRNIVTFD